MKCHWCHKELQIYKNDLVTYECDNGHISIVADKEVIRYTIIWDADFKAQDRYKLRYDGTTTTLSKQDKTNNSYYSTPYKVVLSVNGRIDLIIENDIIQGERMINSLQRLKAFA